jgi:hypothetical protein
MGNVNKWLDDDTVSDKYGNLLEEDGKYLTKNKEMKTSSRGWLRSYDGLLYNGNSEDRTLSVEDDKLETSIINLNDMSSSDINGVFTHRVDSFIFDGKYFITMDYISGNGFKYKIYDQNFKQVNDTLYDAVTLIKDDYLLLTIGSKNTLVNKELNELFKESTFINGVCQQEICFYRANGNVGACIVGGERYKEFYQAKDRDIKLFKAKKTAKWELGRLYETKTTKQVWLGDVTNCLTNEKRHLVLDALGCENTEDIFKQNIFIYDNDLINKFPCKTASDKIFDTSNCSKILAAKQKEKMIKDINDMIDYICNHNNHYILFFNMYLYYIDINDFPKELLIDYLYIYDHYFSLKYGEKYINNKDYVLVNEILEKFNCTHNTRNIDINKILDKYKKE